MVRALLAWLILWESVALPQSVLRRASISPSAPSAFLGVVDGFIQMNTSSAGTTITTAILDAGLIGDNAFGGWSLSTSPLTGVQVAATQQALPASLAVDGAKYLGNTTTKSISYDHTQTTRTYGLAFPAGIRKATVSGWILFGPPQVASGSAALFDYISLIGASSGQYAVVQLNNGGATGSTYGLNIETNPAGVTTHSAYQTLTPGVKYWVSLQADFTGGTASLAIYDTSGTQVGSNITVSQTTGEDIGTLRLGNNETGTASGSTSYFEDFVVDYANAAFPLGPTVGNTAPLNVTHKCSNSTSSSGNTITCTGINSTTGNTLVVTMGRNSSTETISSVSDGTNTYTSASGNPCTGSGTSRRMWVYYSTAATALSSGTITITFGNTNTNFRHVQVSELYAPNGETINFDKLTCGTASSSSVPDPGTTSLTYTKEAIIEGSIVSGGDALGSTFFPLAAPGNNLFQYKVITGGSWGSSAFATANSNWVAIASTFGFN